MTVKTPPCPMCGSGDTGYLHFWYRAGNRDEWLIECYSCGARSQKADTLAAAAALWAKERREDGHGK